MNHFIEFPGLGGGFRANLPIDLSLIRRYFEIKLSKICLLIAVLKKVRYALFPMPMTYDHEYLIFLTKDIVYLAGTSDRKNCSQVRSSFCQVRHFDAGECGNSVNSDRLTCSLGIDYSGRAVFANKLLLAGCRIFKIFFMFWQI
jgi:hypothetical protein